MTVFFTGLSGAGKSAIAKVLTARLLERGGRSFSLLDGGELGFSREHRDLNVRRVGFGAAEITTHGGVASSPRSRPTGPHASRCARWCRAGEGFLEVYVSTALEVCEAPDPNGLYVKARKGLLKNFTGIDTPYEPPGNPDLVIDTWPCIPEEAADGTLRPLNDMGFHGPAEARRRSTGSNHPS
jgi:sulfate adenylyltransferase